MNHSQPFRASDIDAPCDASWEEMRGDDTIRFCTHCNLSVHDVTRMSGKELRRLVARSQGRLCVRLGSRPQDPVKPLPQPLYHIKRYASRVTAGAFGAALGLSAVWASHHTPQQISAFTAQIMPAVDDDAMQPVALLASLRGQVMGVSWRDDEGESGHALRQARIILTNQRTRTVHTVQTDENGEYWLANLPAGEYRLTAKADGFTPFTTHDVTLTISETKWQGVHLERESSIIGGGGIGFNNPVHEAIAWGTSETINYQLLLTMEDVNVKDKRFELTALHLAAARRDISTINFLLARGANPNLRDFAGQTALMAAAWQENPVEFISHEKPRRYDASNAPAAVETIGLLLRAGAEINLADDDGDTALMLAAELGDAAVIRALLAAGANVDLQNDKGETALMLAEKAGNKANAEALLAVSSEL